MASEDLHQILARLRTELSQASTVDDESRRLLHELMRDAERLQASPGEGSSSGLQRLESMAVRFEAKHPTLGAAVRELMELLGQAGV